MITRRSPICRASTCMRWVTLLEALADYTDLERYPAYGGGFIWDLIDQALYHEPTAGSDGEFLAYGGDFEDRPS